MATKIPTIRQVNWTALIPQAIIFGGLYYIWEIFNPFMPFLSAAISFLLLSLILKSTLAKHHRAGMAKVKLGQFKGAIDDFKASYTHFKEKEWIDQYRAVTLLSSSKLSYLEMALVNVAFCYGQIGDGENAKAYYEKALEEFPDSQIAQTALKMLDSMLK